MTHGLVAIRSTGMLTGVGQSAAASCAAMRCGLNVFADTRFQDRAGNWIRGSAAPLPEAWGGRDRIVQMAAAAIGDCLDSAAWDHDAPLALLLLVAEESRPGRVTQLDRTLLDDLEAAMSRTFVIGSDVMPRGRIGIGRALQWAARTMESGKARACVIAGSDSLLRSATLAGYEGRDRMLTSLYTDGFLPGEAAAAILVVPTAEADPQDVVCLGVGFGRERASIDSGEPLRGDGMTQAFAEALKSAGLDLGDIDYRIADLSGGSYAFKEAELAMNRLLRVRKERVELWHPADCIGETGAAIGPCTLGVALTAARKGYAPGPRAICHFSADDDRRVAVVVSTPAGSY